MRLEAGEAVRLEAQEAARRSLTWPPSHVPWRREEGVLPAHDDDRREGVAVPETRRARVSWAGARRARLQGIPHRHATERALEGRVLLGRARLRLVLVERGEVEEDADVLKAPRRVQRQAARRVIEETPLARERFGDGAQRARLGVGLLAALPAVRDGHNRQRVGRLVATPVLPWELGVEALELVGGQDGLGVLRLDLLAARQRLRLPPREPLLDLDAPAILGVPLHLLLHLLVAGARHQPAPAQQQHVAIAQRRQQRGRLRVLRRLRLLLLSLCSGGGQEMLTH